jgi:hypothetical protein
MKKKGKERKEKIGLVRIHTYATSNYSREGAFSVGKRTEKPTGQKREFRLAANLNLLCRKKLATLSIRL